MAFLNLPARNTAMRSRVHVRVLYGATMIAVIAGLLYLDWWLEAALRAGGESKIMLLWPLLEALPTAVVLVALLTVGFRELARLANAAGIKLLGVSGLLATAIVATEAYWYRLLDILTSSIGVAYLTVPLLSLGLLGMFAEQMIRYRTEAAFRRIAATALAVVYLGLCGGLIFAIRLRGVGQLVLFLAAVKFTDIGAYFTGITLGRHKMIPWLSPGKSWEGLAGGLAAGAAISVLVAYVLKISELWFWEAIVFGVVVGLAGQFGDLCESLLKRSACAKDSGSVVPEFGGVLDIIDSPLLAAPIALILLSILM